MSWRGLIRGSSSGGSSWGSSSWGSRPSSRRPQHQEKGGAHQEHPGKLPHQQQDHRQQQEGGPLLGVLRALGLYRQADHQGDGDEGHRRGHQEEDQQPRRRRGQQLAGEPEHLPLKHRQHDPEGEQAHPHAQGEGGQHLGPEHLPEGQGAVEQGLQGVLLPLPHKGGRGHDGGRHHRDDEEEEGQDIVEQQVQDLPLHALPPGGHREEGQELLKVRRLLRGGVEGDHRHRGQEHREHQGDHQQGHQHPVVGGDRPEVLSDQGKHTAVHGKASSLWPMRWK